jgi:hypothetical protein
MVLRTLFQLKFDFDPAVENTPFQVCVNFTEGWILIWRKNDWPEAALPRVGNVFGVDEEAELAEGLFAKNAQHPVRLSSEPVGQKLAARIVRLNAGLEILLFLKQQCRV